MKHATSLAFALCVALSSTANARECDSKRLMKSKNHSSPSEPNLVDTADNAGTFKTLLAAVKAAGLVEALTSDKKLTVFAPTDAAFAKLPEGTIQSLLKPQNKDQLIKILTYHVIPGEVAFKDAVGLEQATALNKLDLTVNVKEGALFLNESRVINNDIQTSNGIIHVIDTVLLPPEDHHASPVKHVIISAIEKGAPLYNHGQHGACADIYELTAEALLLLPDTQLKDAQRNMLQKSLAKSQVSRSDRTRAWTMRLALNNVIASIH